MVPGAENLPPAADEALNPAAFRFRGLGPRVRLGTASDRYAGWLGQIYTEERYRGRLQTRTRRLGGRSFVETVLPVESVREYFEHFATLELDFTFYGFLLSEDGRPTPTHRTLCAYREHLGDGDRLILKVPQAVFARNIRRREGMVPNERYLDPKAFVRRYYEPATELLGPWLDGILFEQEYQRKADRPLIRDYALELDRFFRAIPPDPRYHVELRTEAFLKGPVLEVLEAHGVGQVLSHWTWLPSLWRQFSMGGKRFLNRKRHAIVRLMTPRGMRYEEAYAMAHPFDRLVEGMTGHDMVRDAAGIALQARAQGARVSIIVNNRAGGNAPLIARALAESLIAAPEKARD